MSVNESIQSNVRMGRAINWLKSFSTLTSNRPIKSKYHKKANMQKHKIAQFGNIELLTKILSISIKSMR